MTGTPPPPGTPEATVAVVKVWGWPWLSVWFRSIHHDQSPLLLPSDALVCQLLKVSCVL